MPSHDFRCVHLPYCIKRLPDGRHVVLNRDYKPLGFKTREHVEYESYPIAVKLKGDIIFDKPINKRLTGR